MAEQATAHAWLWNDFLPIMILHAHNVEGLQHCGQYCKQRLLGYVQAGTHAPPEPESKFAWILNVLPKFPCPVTQSSEVTLGREERGLWVCVCVM